MLLRTVSVLAAVGALASAGHALAQSYAPSNAGPAYENSSSDDVVVSGRYARPGAALHSRRVAFADLDLDSFAGARTLMARIHGAATQVCSPEPSAPVDLSDNADYRDCVNDAVSGAVADVDSPTLNQAFDISYRR